MFGIGMSEMLLIGIIALIFIGPDQIPETARMIGKFINELRRSADTLKQDLTADLKIPKTIDEVIAAANAKNHQDPTPKYDNHEPVKDHFKKEDT